MNQFLRECLKKGRKTCGMTQSEVAEAIGAKRSTIAGYERGTADPDIDTYMKLCRLYGLNYVSIFNKAYNMIGDQNTSLSTEEDRLLEKFRILTYKDKSLVISLIDRFIDPPEMKIEEEPIHYITKPAYMISPSAGTGQWLPDDLPMVDIPVPDTPETEKADFILKVFGKSMEPKYKDGDLVLVKKADAVDIGKVGIFVVNGEALIKECRDGILHSINPEYGDIILKNDDVVHCLGEVIGTLNKKGIILNKTQ